METFYQVVFCGNDFNNVPFHEIILISKCDEYVKHYIAAYNKIYPDIGQLTVRRKTGSNVCEKEITTEKFRELIAKCKKKES